MSRLALGVVLAALVLLAALVGAGWLAGSAERLQDPAAATGAPEGVITIGSVCRAPKEESERFQPLGDCLARRLGAHGIGRARIVVASSIPEMADLLRRGEVDLYIDSAFPVARAGRLSGARPMLRRWKKGLAEYESVLFTRRDGGISGLEDLRGRVVAFDEPHSTTGYLLPKAALVEAGLTLGECGDPPAPVPADRVGYVFARGDENAVFWVLRGKVAAAATDSMAHEREIAERFRVLWRSASIPRQLVCRRPDLEPALAAAIEEALLGLDRDEEGREALRRFEMTARFDRIPGGPEAALAPIQRAIDLLGGG